MVRIKGYSRFSKRIVAANGWQLIDEALRGHVTCSGDREGDDLDTIPSGIVHIMKTG